MTVESTPQINRSQRRALEHMALRKEPRRMDRNGVDSILHPTKGFRRVTKFQKYMEKLQISNALKKTKK